LQVRASPTSSGRRSLHVPAALRPQAQVTAQPRLSEVNRPRPSPHTMTTQRGHRQRLPIGDPRAHPASPVGHSVGLAHCQPPPTTRTKSKSTLRWPSTACRQLRGPGSNLGQTTRRHGHRGRPRRPSQSCGCRPPHPATSSRRTQRTPDARTPGANTGHLDAQTPHRTPVTWTGTRGTPDARTGHWTPDAGHERGHGDGSTAGIRTLLGRHAERPHAETRNRLVLTHYQPTARPLRRPSGASAHCCPQTITDRA
jgi:hypothetical protein